MNTFISEPFNEKLHFELETMIVCKNHWKISKHVLIFYLKLLYIMPKRPGHDQAYNIIYLQ